MYTCRKLMRKLNIRKKQPYKNVGGAIVILLIVAIGIYTLTASHADSQYTSLEAESGTLSVGATVQTDNNASGGKVVQFGNAGSPFVKVCSMQLCFNNQPFIIHGATDR